MMEQRANIVNFSLPNRSFNHFPFTPDLALYDYFSFPKLKMKLKRKHFDAILDIQKTGMPDVFGSIRPVFF